MLVLAMLAASVGCSSGGSSLDGGDDAVEAPVGDGDGRDSDSAARADVGDAPIESAAADKPGDGGGATTDAPDAPDTPPAPARTVGALYCPPAGSAFPASPLPASAPMPTQINFSPPDGIAFLEGPVWLADAGVLLFSEFTDQHRILQLTPPQTVDVFFPSSRTNGLAVTPDGKALLMVTDSPPRNVSRLSLADKSVQPVVNDFNGQAFIQPNDLIVRADGTIFFTDYQAGRLYRRTLDGTTTLVDSQQHANGVGLSPDETTLYLNADTHTVKYPLAVDSAVGAGTDLAAGLRGADGIAVDCAGNVFIAQNNGGSLVVISAAGSKIGEIGNLPLVVTNAAFGGPDRQTLYITTSTALYSIRLQIPGLPY